MAAANPHAWSREALTAEWGREAVFIGGGGSIPVTAELKQALGMDVVLAGFRSAYRAGPGAIAF